MRLCERFMYLGAEIILKTNNTWNFTGLQNIKNLSHTLQFFFSKKSGYAGQSGFNER